MDMHHDIPLMYKYFPPERIDVLEGLKISFTRPRWFNDPFELNPVESGGRGFDGEARRAIRGRINREIKADFEEIWQRYLQGQHVAHVDDSVGILCLSANPRSLLMWAHYAASHAGFMIEFTPGREFYNSLGAPLKVRYVAERPVLDMDDDDKYFDTFVTKSEEWSYEDEYRIIAHRSELEVFTPAPGIDLLVRSIDPKSISRIVLGCKMAAGSRERIMGIAKSEQFTHVKIKEAKLHTRIFAVKYYDVYNK